MVEFSITQSITLYFGKQTKRHFYFQLLVNAPTAYILLVSGNDMIVLWETGI